MRCGLAVALAGIACVLPAQAQVTVRAKGDVAVAGARLQVVLPAAAPLPGRSPARIVRGVTDERGRLPFSLPRTRGAMLVVDAPGYAPLAMSLERAAPEQITLPRGWSVSGEVADATGRQVEAGFVCAIWRPVPADLTPNLAIERCGEILSDGRFELVTLPVGDVQLQLSVPGFLPYAQALSVPALPLSVRLQAGHRVRVRVVSARAPVAGAQVRCVGAVPITSDAAGEAVVALPTPTGTCEAAHPELGRSAPTQVSAAAGSNLVLQLVRRGGVRGKLIGDDGAQIADFRIELVQEFDRGNRFMRKTVDPELLPDGTFRVPIDHRGPVALEFLAESWRPHSTGQLQVDPGTTVDLGEIVLARGAGVRGMALDARSAEPIAAAVVTAEPVGRAQLLLGQQFRAVGLAREDGQFQASGLPAGRYRVRIDAPGLAPWEDELNLTETGLTDLGSLFLYPYVRVEGAVVRRHGSAVGQATVQVARGMGREPLAVATTQTDSDGRLAPFLCPPGHLRVLVHQDRLLIDQEFDVAPGTEALELELRVPSTRLDGLVTENGIPVGGGELLISEAVEVAASLGIVQLNSRSSGQQAWAGRPQAPTTVPVEPDGTFSLLDSPVGLVRLRYFGFDGRRATRAVHIPSTPTAQVVVEIGGHTVEGQIAPAVSADGVGARLELRDADGQIVGNATSTSTGEFALAGVPIGAYRLRVDYPGYRPTGPIDFVVADTGSSPLFVELVRSEELSDLVIKLSRADGSPAPAVPIVLLDASHSMVRAIPTSSTGDLRVSNLGRGGYQLIWADPYSGTGATAEFDLASSEKRLDIELEEGRDLIVHCVGGPCAGARLPWLSVLTHDGLDLAPYLLRSSAVLFSDDGTARIGKLSPGRYRVVGSAGGQRFEKALLVSSGPGEVDLTVPLR